ncbi:hypothetical protein [Saccharicrinis fermentans]|uniref:Uncharacterized protein n=1 Tax=Saccharicrinis fermentans DSM 9555 = JCM 21142 TaxID=869213 RepID=W7YBZ7_9BACT|nr:hypothetical protein [Saccharicrinis fermentans]GAF05982.1 hypothetical protein JCM21142_134748 [Saccharicrinis fermentans DSM 9555 = JCM 21142]
MNNNRCIGILLLLLFFSKIYSQTECTNESWLQETKKRYSGEISIADDISDYIKYDYSNALIGRKNFNIGFIGVSKKRLEIEFLSSVKNTRNENKYFISGQTTVANNLRSFHGIISIDTVYINSRIKYGIEDGMTDSIVKQGFIIGRYEFYENKNETSTGFFEGIFFNMWFLDTNGIIRFDGLEDFSDSYCNNLFKGTWTSYKTEKTVPCNWGQYRIPCSGDLDIGTAEFMPNPKYKNVGWDKYLP